MSVDLDEGTPQVPGETNDASEFWAPTEGIDSTVVQDFAPRPKSSIFGDAKSTNKNPPSKPKHAYYSFGTGQQAGTSGKHRLPNLASRRAHSPFSLYESDPNPADTPLGPSLSSLQQDIEVKLELLPVLIGLQSSLIKDPSPRELHELHVQAQAAVRYAENCDAGPPLVARCQYYLALVNFTIGSGRGDSETNGPEFLFEEATSALGYSESDWANQWLTKLMDDQSRTKKPEPPPEPRPVLLRTFSMLSSKLWPAAKNGDQSEPVPQLLPGLAGRYQQLCKPDQDRTSVRRRNRASQTSRPSQPPTTPPPSFTRQAPGNRHSLSSRLSGFSNISQRSGENLADYSVGDWQSDRQMSRTSWNSDSSFAQDTPSRGLSRSSTINSLINSPVQRRPPPLLHRQSSQDNSGSPRSSPPHRAPSGPLPKRSPTDRIKSPLSTTRPLSAISTTGSSSSVSPEVSSPTPSIGGRLRYSVHNPDPILPRYNIDKHPSTSNGRGIQAPIPPHPNSNSTPKQSRSQSLIIDPKNLPNDNNSITQCSTYSHTRKRSLLDLSLNTFLRTKAESPLDVYDEAEKGISTSPLKTAPPASAFPLTSEHKLRLQRQLTSPPPRRKTVATFPVSQEEIEDLMEKGESPRREGFGFGLGGGRWEGKVKEG